MSVSMGWCFHCNKNIPANIFFLSVKFIFDVVRPLLWNNVRHLLETVVSLSHFLIVVGYREGKTFLTHFIIFFILLYVSHSHAGIMKTCRRVWVLEYLQANLFEGEWYVNRAEVQFRAWQLLLNTSNWTRTWLDQLWVTFGWYEKGLSEQNCYFCNQNWELLLSTEMRIDRSFFKTN